MTGALCARTASARLATLRCRAQILPVRPVLDVLEHRRTFRLPAEHPARLVGAYAAVRAEGGERARAPFAHRLLDRPVLGLAAEAEETADRRRQRLPRCFAVLGIEQRAGRSALERQQV